MKRLHSGGYIAGAALAGLAISACSTMSPIQTSESYNPGDGVPASSGPVTARNLLVVADQKGGPGNLSGSLLNTSDASVQVSFQTREAADANPSPGTPDHPGRPRAAADHRRDLPEHAGRPRLLDGDLHGHHSR